MPHGDVRSLRRPLIALAIVASTAVALAGCVADEPSPTRSARPSASPSASASSAPALIIDGTAKQNLAYFDSVNQRLIAAGGDLGGRAFIDNLVARGFTKADMEVTPDETSVGLKADNITFSVKLGDGCLIGEYGNVGYASQATTALGTGKCLIGTTRTIDW